MVYLQVDRGVAPRNHLFPGAAPEPDRHRPPSPCPRARTGAGRRVVTLPDQRWARCDIKSVSLLPNMLAKQQAGGRLPRGLAGRWRRLCHRRHLLQRLDRRRARAGWSPARSAPTSWAASRARRAGARPPRPASPRRARPSRRGGDGGARGLPHQHDLARPSGVSIDGRPVANGRPGPMRRSLLARTRSVRDSRLPWQERESAARPQRALPRGTRRDLQLIARGVRATSCASLDASDRTASARTAAQQRRRVGR